MDLHTLGGAITILGWLLAPLLLLPILCLFAAKAKFSSDLQYQICTLIDDVNIAVGEGVKWLLVALVVSTAFGVIALSIFGQAWTKFDESATYFHVSVILLGSAATLLAGRHVRVDIFYTKFSARQKAWTEIIGFYVLLMPFCLVLLWNAQNFVALSWVSLEGSPESDGIKGIFILKTLISVFALMVLAQGLSLSGRAALLLTDKKHLPCPPELINRSRSNQNELARLSRAFDVCLCLRSAYGRLRGGVHTRRRVAHLCCDWCFYRHI